MELEHLLMYLLYMHMITVFKIIGFNMQMVVLMVVLF